MTLIEFLRARLDEDGHAARAAGDANPAPWRADDGYITGGETARNRHLDGGLWDNESAASLSMEAETAEHIARHDPAHVLAEVAAKRRMVEEHGEDRGSCSTCGTAGEYDVPWPCTTVELLALPYATHPDYRPEWAPTS